jgi:hypothetical protein
VEADGQITLSTLTPRKYLRMLISENIFCKDIICMYVQVRPLPCAGVLKFVNLQDGSNWHIDPITDYSL